VEGGSAEPARILIVTLDARLGQRLRRDLGAAGYQVRWEWSTLVALAAVAEWQPALVVLDWQQPFLDSPTFTAALQVGLPAPPPVLALTATDTIDAIRPGVAAILSTTAEPADLIAAVDRILVLPDAGPSY
jgi:DNA-binding response OmpR family regulator